MMRYINRHYLSIYLSIYLTGPVGHIHISVYALWFIFCTYSPGAPV